MTTSITLMVLSLLGLVEMHRDDRWFPAQSAPKGLVRTLREDQFPEPGIAYRMLVQSVAGLAAKAVNEGRLDEMVWAATGNSDLEHWGAALTGRPGSPELRGTLDPWALVDRFRDRGIIRGYILYRLDGSRGAINEHRPGMDLSVNVATSLAGLLDGILVAEGLEAEARSHGLRLLLDARGRSQAWCFETYKERFNRGLLLTQDPRKSNVRDLAIAQKALTIYGDDEPLAAALRWLEPLSPILGWNGGDEFETTRASTVQGHFQTATDWCMNLPVLMAGARAGSPARVQAFDPRGIDWADRRSAVSFVCSDGDNVQWLQGNFFGNGSFWASKSRGRIPFGWSCCFAHLAQLCPPAVDHAVRGQTPNDRFLEWGGGYYYPDLFAAGRPDRWTLVAEHSRRTWAWMTRSGTRVIGFNVATPGSEDALKAYATFAAQTDGLLGILVFQYAPYEGGAGRTYWVRDRRGEEVPVVTARYSIWEHTNDRPRSGTPARVAREIRQTVSGTPEAQLPRYDWVIANAWSYFRRSPGGDEDAENLPQAEAERRDGERGYAPVIWCAERLPDHVRVIDPEELIWRIRMQHAPRQTGAEIDRFRP